MKEVSEDKSNAKEMSFALKISVLNLVPCIFGDFHSGLQIKKNGVFRKRNPISLQ